MKRSWRMLLIPILIIMTPFFSEAKGFKEFSQSINNVAAQIAKQKNFAIQDTEKVEDEDGFYGEGPFIVYGRLWQTKHTLMSLGYNERWQKAIVNYFSTDDPELKFYGGIKIGTPLILLKKIFSEDNDTFISVEKNCFVVEGELSEIIFGIKQDKVAFIRARYGDWPRPEKIEGKVTEDIEKWDEVLNKYQNNPIER